MKKRVNGKLLLLSQMMGIATTGMKKQEIGC